MHARGVGSCRSRLATTGLDRETPSSSSLPPRDGFRCCRTKPGTPSRPGSLSSLRSLASQNPLHRPFFRSRAGRRETAGQGVSAFGFFYNDTGASSRWSLRICPTTLPAAFQTEKSENSGDLQRHRHKSICTPFYAPEWANCSYGSRRIANTRERVSRIDSGALTSSAKELASSRRRRGAGAAKT